MDFARNLLRNCPGDLLHKLLGKICICQGGFGGEFAYRFARKKSRKIAWEFAEEICQEKIRGFAVEFAFVRKCVMQFATNFAGKICLVGFAEKNLRSLPFARNLLRLPANLQGSSRNLLVHLPRKYASENCWQVSRQISKFSRQISRCPVKFPGFPVKFPVFPVKFSVFPVKFSVFPVKFPGFPSNSKFSVKVPVFPGFPSNFQFFPSNFQVSRQISSFSRQISNISCQISKFSHQISRFPVKFDFGSYLWFLSSI